MKTKFVFIIFLLTFSIHCVAQSGLSCTEYNDYILTHELTPAGPVPTAFDPNGVYPYVSYVATAPKPIIKTYRFIPLENDRLRVVICPDLGGKVVSIVLKGSGRKALYSPGRIKPSGILP